MDGTWHTIDTKWTIIQPIRTGNITVTAPIHGSRNFGATLTNLEIGSTYRVIAKADFMSSWASWNAWTAGTTTASGNFIAPLSRDFAAGDRLDAELQVQVNGTWYTIDSAVVIVESPPQTNTPHGGSGMYYMRARWYDPTTARFITQDPIRDGMNWYIYANNNPISYIDPWGLASMWNEANNHWFALRYEVEDGGGSISNWDARTSTATVSMYGVSVNFQNGSTGIEIRSDGKMYVRADVFYSSVASRATEVGILGTHNVLGNNYHTSTIIFVSSDSSYYNDSRFTANGTRWGSVRYATIGAGDGGNILQSGVNRPRDADLNNKVQMQWLYTSIGRARQLFDADWHYRTNYNNLNYDLWPEVGVTTGYGKGYNSNSFTAGLLRSTGINAPRPSYNVPGWDKPVPTSYFGR